MRPGGVNSAARRRCDRAPCGGRRPQVSFAGEAFDRELHALVFDERSRRKLPAAPWAIRCEGWFPVELPARILASKQLEFNADIRSLRLLESDVHARAAVTSEPRLSSKRLRWHHLVKPFAAPGTLPDVIHGRAIGLHVACSHRHIVGKVSERDPWSVAVAIHDPLPFGATDGQRLGSITVIERDCIHGDNLIGRLRAALDSGAVRCHGPQGRRQRSSGRAYCLPRRDAGPDARPQGGARLSTFHIHSGTLVCMDAAGTVARGDLLVRDGVIAAVGSAVPL